MSLLWDMLLVIPLLFVASLSMPLISPRCPSQCRQLLLFFHCLNGWCLYPIVAFYPWCCFSLVLLPRKYMCPFCMFSSLVLLPICLWSVLRYPVVAGYINIPIVACILVASCCCLKFYSCRFFPFCCCSNSFCFLCISLLLIRNCCCLCPSSGLLYQYCSCWHPAC